MSQTAPKYHNRKSQLDQFAEAHPQPTRGRRLGDGVSGGKVEEPENFETMLKKLGTKAGVIRYLTSLKKYSRNAIAEFVGSQYQYVRAVQAAGIDGRLGNSSGGNEGANAGEEHQKAA